MGQGLTPSVQDGREADLGSKMLGVAGDRLERLGRGLEQNAVDDRLVLEGHGRDRLRYREDHMEVLDR
jgi:hypothetical protein